MYEHRDLFRSYTAFRDQIHLINLLLSSYACDVSGSTGFFGYHLPRPRYEFREREEEKRFTANTAGQVFMRRLADRGVQNLH